MWTFLCLIQFLEQVTINWKLNRPVFWNAKIQVHNNTTRWPTYWTISYLENCITYSISSKRLGQQKIIYISVDSQLSMVMDGRNSKNNWKQRLIKKSGNSHYLCSTQPWVSYSYYSLAVLTLTDRQISFE